MNKIIVWNLHNLKWYYVTINYTKWHYKFKLWLYQVATFIPVRSQWKWISKIFKSFTFSVKISVSSLLVRFFHSSSNIPEIFACFHVIWNESMLIKIPASGGQVWLETKNSTREFIKQNNKKWETSPHKFYVCWRNCRWNAVVTCAAAHDLVDVSNTHVHKSWKRVECIQ